MPEKILVKSVLNKTRKRDSWFLDDYTVNPYSGCSFNCLYCYIRGSKYGTHMEERLRAKDNVADVLHKQLRNRAKRKEYGIIVLSSATDPYLQIEKELGLTRQILEVILHHRFPVHIITKSALVTRDFDLLKRIDEHSILPDNLQSVLGHRAIITFSFSTVVEEIARIFEPGATPPARRLEAVEKTLSAGFLSGISMMPLLPYITDGSDHLEKMFKTFHEIGAQYVLPASLTLFGSGEHDSKTLMFQAINKHYPHLEEKYRQLFSLGFQPNWNYRTSLERLTKELGIRYHLRNTLYDSHNARH